MNSVATLCMVISSFNLSGEAKKTACEYMPYIVEQSQAADLKPETILSIIYVESRFEKSARSKSNACGLMQLIPKWNKEKINGKLIKHTCKEIMEPKRNIRLGIRALKKWLASTGSMDRALCGYNAGNVCRKPRRKDRDSGKKYIKNPAKFRYVKAVRSTERKIRFRATKMTKK